MKRKNNNNNLYKTVKRDAWKREKQLTHSAPSLQ